MAGGYWTLTLHAAESVQEDGWVYVSLAAVHVSVDAKGRSERDARHDRALLHVKGDLGTVVKRLLTGLGETP